MIQISGFAVRSFGVYEANDPSLTILFSNNTSILHPCRELFFCDFAFLIRFVFSGEKGERELGLGCRFCGVEWGVVFGPSFVYSSNVTCVRLRKNLLEGGNEKGLQVRGD